LQAQGGAKQHPEKREHGEKAAADRRAAGKAALEGSGQAAEKH
jgi:hypothetical protein